MFKKLETGLGKDGPRRARMIPAARDMAEPPGVLL